MDEEERLGGLTSFAADASKLSGGMVSVGGGKHALVENASLTA